MRVWKSTLLLVIGAGIGCLGVQLALRSGGGDVGFTAASTGHGIEPADWRSVASALGADVSPARARLAIYEWAATMADVETLAATIRSVAGEPASALGHVALEALSARLTAIDPGAAARLAQALDLDLTMLVSAFQGWAGVDADAALAALAAMPAGGRQHAVALALLDVFGNDRHGVAEIAAALAELDRFGFKSAALAERAADDPAGALDDVMAEADPGLQELLLADLLVALRPVDPSSVLALARRIADVDLRQRYIASELAYLADTNPEFAFAYLESIAAGELASIAYIPFELARLDPERVLALVERLPSTAPSGMQLAAIQTLAERDAAAALRHLESVRPGREREAVLFAIAMAYGRQSPDAALAWTRALGPSSPASFAGVVQGIAALDLDRAVDLLAAEMERFPESAYAQQLSVVAGSLAARNRDSAQRVLYRVLDWDLDEDLERSALQSAVTSWAATDAAGAMDWLLAQAGALTPESSSNLVRLLASSAPAAATVVLERVPIAERSEWIAGIAAGMAREDIEAATSFVDRYRGQAGYAEGQYELVRAWASVDPALAAGLVSQQAPASAPRQLAPQIAASWATLDPGAAGSWASQLAEAPLREAAIGAVAETWSQLDPDAAGRWVLGLEAGPARDAGLASVLLTAAGHGAVDLSLLDAFDSDAARQQGMVNAVLQLGASHPDEARRLMQSYIREPQLRRIAASQLTRMAASGAAAPYIAF